MKDPTKLIEYGRYDGPDWSVVNPPVFHASTILHRTVSRFKETRSLLSNGEDHVNYGRVGPPTARMFEQAIADLEGGFRTLTYSSGLAAIGSSLLAFLKPGDHVLVPDNVYGATRRFCSGTLARLNIECSFYDVSQQDAISRLFRPQTRVLLIEAPGSLTFEMPDIPALVAVARDNGAITIMDNTWASPLYYKPLANGVDVSVQAATKYICGHSDAMMGVVTTNQECFAPLRELTHQLGQCASPDEIYLAMRGLRTLAVRLERHSRTAVSLAQWLKTRPEVQRVLYPALPDDPGHEIWKRDFKGSSGLFGVVLRPVPESAVAAMIDGLRHFGIGASWGGFESLIIPAWPEKLRTENPWQGDGVLLRLHAGLEDPDDLIADLSDGLDRLAAN